MPAARVSPAGEPRSWSPTPAADGQVPEVAPPASPGDTPSPLPISSRERLSTTTTASTITTTTTCARSPYQRLLDALCSDERWQKDVALGRRVGFYRFRGELGTGNFSQVKVAVHCLVKGETAVVVRCLERLFDYSAWTRLRLVCLPRPFLLSPVSLLMTCRKCHAAGRRGPGDGTAAKVFCRKGRSNQKTTFCSGVLFGHLLDTLHHHNIIHRDLKAENVFIAGHNNVKVGDLGFSTEVRSRDESLNTFCGSPPYAAPELFKDESYVGPCVDIWALGILLYFIVTSAMPFKAQTVAALKKLILEGQYTVPTYLSEPCKALIAGILQVAPQDRLTLEEIKSSEWLEGQRFPEGYPKYNMYPTMDPTTHVSEEEKETRAHLEELGISEDLMKDCIDKGARSSITGAYRIVLHKIQTAPSLQDLDSESAGTATGTPSPRGKADRISNKAERLFSAKKRKSRTCVLL
ncbi:unnamed protein product [Ixodes hexagonus]